MGGPPPPPWVGLDGVMVEALEGALDLPVAAASAPVVLALSVGVGAMVEPGTPVVAVLGLATAAEVVEGVVEVVMDPLTTALILAIEWVRNVLVTPEALVTACSPNAYLDNA